MPPPLPRLSEESEESFDSYGSAANGASVNFSRPRPTHIGSTQSRSSNSTISSGERSARGNVHAISAFADTQPELPDEPRFSNDSDRTTSTSLYSSGSSAASEFVFDVPRVRRDKYAQQRYEPTSRPRPQPASDSRQGSYNLLEQQRTNTSTSTPSSTETASRNAITKRMSVDQQSERISLSTEAGEDDASHHTVSDDEDSGSFDMEGNWQSSNYDTSGLSDAQIRKLLKKGINPSLYAEMKAAKKGKKKLIGPLLGNSFLG
ncbi:hypothetical protein LTR09_003896 [Extremus antarcticus]|uniref:Uncharacterized protein n=1 Tax=Extremus antarcticus TaxID=702011 RepID=A0AAJ0DJV1_9PEZI|nr:hypothetical protein LTR09_003896 [Extremus antarcticus]